MRDEPGFSIADVPVSVSVTLSYYWSVILIQTSRYEEAEGKICWALSQLCPTASENSAEVQHFQHRKQLHLLLVPLRLRRGIMPSTRLLERYGLREAFGEIADSLRRGDLAKFESFYRSYSQYYVKLGIANLLRQVKYLVVRQFVKFIIHFYNEHQAAKAALHAGNHTNVIPPPPPSIKVSFNLFTRCFAQFAKASGPHSVAVSDVDMESLIAILLAYGAVKGYLSVKHNKLVIPNNETAFPRVEVFSDNLLKI